jgi:hypothetical protein
MASFGAGFGNVHSRSSPFSEGHVFEPSSQEWMATAGVEQEDFSTMTRPASIPQNAPVAPTPLPHASGTGCAMSQDDIISNLEDAEYVVYGQAFSMLANGGSGRVGLDFMAMREFLLNNTAITMEDIDIELLKVASPDEGIGREGFLDLLREFPVSEADSLAHFMDLSGNGESMASEECRTGLLLFGQQKLRGNFSEDKWERILNTIMWDAGVEVAMDQWLVYSKLIARMVRLSQNVRNHKGVSGTPGHTGVIGGA